MSVLKIGEVARRADVSIDTIRYYERSALLPPPRRLASGYRVYDAQAIDRLRFIRHAKGLGFTLDEIRELLDINAHHDVKAVKAAATRKLALVDSRLAELQRIRSVLAELVDQCAGSGPVERCPILAALNDDDPSPP